MRGENITKFTHIYIIVFQVLKKTGDKKTTSKTVKQEHF